MAYRDLIPEGSHVLATLSNLGLDPEQQRSILLSVIYVLDERAQYWGNEHEVSQGHVSDGVETAISELADEFRDALSAVPHEAG